MRCSPQQKVRTSRVEAITSPVYGNLRIPATVSPERLKRGHRNIQVGEAFSDVLKTLPFTGGITARVDRHLTQSKETTAQAYQEKTGRDIAPGGLHADLAMLYFHTGDTERALAENQLVLREDPENLYALYNAALMANARGELPEAAAYYRRYLAALPQEERHRLKYADHPELILVQQATAQRELARLAAQGY